jgi:hypothetical protein
LKTYSTHGWMVNSPMSGFQVVTTLFTPFQSFSDLALTLFSYLSSALIFPGSFVMLYHGWRILVDFSCLYLFVRDLVCTMLLTGLICPLRLACIFKTNGIVWKFFFIDHTFPSSHITSYLPLTLPMDRQRCSKMLAVQLPVAECVSWY